MFIQAGIILILAGAIILLICPRWSPVPLSLGFFATLAGLIFNCRLSDGFHFELAATKTFLLPPFFGILAVGMMYSGTLRNNISNGKIPDAERAGRYLAPWIIIVSILSLLSPLPDQQLSLKILHISAPLYFFTEALSMILLASSSCLAIGVLIDDVDLPEPLTGTLLLLGFIVFSACQLLGAWWAWLGWGLPFHWSHRHLIGAAVWCAYGAALHLRYTAWSNRSRARVLALCISPLLLPYLFRLGEFVFEAMKGGVR